MHRHTKFELLIIIILTWAGCNSSTEKNTSPNAPAQKMAENTPVIIEKTSSVTTSPPQSTPPPPPGMRRVPGGTFTMGLNHPRAIPDEMTEHEVRVKSFFLDKTEVTNAAYTECVKSKICKKPKIIDTKKSGFEALHLFGRSNHPVSGVSRQDAMDYCKWKSKRLPTEAEFERAARGDDGRLYAWGNQSPSPTRAVYASKITQPVGSKPEGAGPYGHLDLAGNVWEWTADVYDPFAYMRQSAIDGIPADCETIKKTQQQLRKDGKQGFTGTNPIPTECDHVLRGGAFNYFSWGLRASNRVHHPQSWKMIMAGFRCAKDILE